MLRKVLVTIALTGALGAAASQPLSAQNVAGPRGARQATCVGAPQHKLAQQLRVQALESERGAVNARLAAAQAGNHPRAVAHLTARIAKINAHITKVQANITAFAARCP